ncbi:hypothetical protein AcW2_007170 [Taiwanofungus camphoratus]|nr:hypothetical protein AcW2_007170 [Antrodia cinnamomea]
MEALLSSHGAKAWDVLYPEDRADVNVKNVFNVYWLGFSLGIASNFDLNYHRVLSSYATDTVAGSMITQYDRLFEACRDGDNVTIQSLCLSKPGGSKSEETPLQIVVRFGSLGYTPLFFGGDRAPLEHRSAAAQHLLEQYKEKFQTRNGALDDEDENDTDSDDDEDLKMDDNVMDFTDIAKRPSIVRTAATPRDFLEGNVIRWLSKDGKLCYGVLLQKIIMDDDLEAFV